MKQLIATAAISLVIAFSASAVQAANAGHAGIAGMGAAGGGSGAPVTRAEFNRLLIQVQALEARVATLERKSGHSGGEGAVGAHGGVGAHHG